MFRLIRDELGPVLLDVENQTFQRIPDAREKFIIDGRMFDFSDTIAEFLESEKVNAIIPVWCESTGSKGKRDFITLLSGQGRYTFFSIERVGGEWVKNKIEKMNPNRAYFVYLESHPDMINECLILTVRLI